MKKLKQISTELGYLKEDAPGPTGMASQDRFGGIAYGIDKPKDYFGQALDKLKGKLKYQKDVDRLTKIRITYSEKQPNKFYSLTYTYSKDGISKSKRLSQYARAKAFLESEREKVPGGPVLNIQKELPKRFDKKSIPSLF